VAAIKLTKGNPINLTKEAPGLKNLTIGLGWDLSLAGEAYDLDASVMITDENDRILFDDASLIFFNNPTSLDGAVVHTGDNRTGDAEGDDETIIVNLDKVDPKVQRLHILASIYEGEKTGKNFGVVRNAYVRLINDDTNEEIARYDLSEDCSAAPAVLFAMVYRHNGEWRFKAVEDPFTGGLPHLLTSYGFTV
jgi:tellurium resistance protein terE